MLPIFSYPRQKKDVLDRLDYSPTDDLETRRAVEKIILDVRKTGDKALFRYTKKFDGVSLNEKTVRVPASALEASWKALDAKTRKALTLAKKRITAFHKKQVRESWSMRDAEGFRLTQRWMPVDSAGLYAPGGTAAYPSSVLMDAIPAKVAGVKRLVGITPPAREGQSNRVTLGAMYLAGVDEVYQVGGAQAIAALALGTVTIPRVDVIVGPGNRFVAEAKRLLYGTVKIDMVAGPSEVLIVADQTAPLEWIAADMLAQAEHDPVAQAITVLVGRKDAKSLAKEVARQVAEAPRREILEQSLPNRGMIIQVPNEEKALELVNHKAPEHLELMTASAKQFAGKVRHAGSIFIGNYAAEAVGDYIAGPNHVLPTGGSARHSSPLSVQDFLKMTQIIECSAKSLQAVGEAAAQIADMEGLDAHAQSIRLRLKK